MNVREATLNHGRESDPTRGAAALKAKIGATTAILAAQFWGLTATLAAWQSGDGPALRASLAFQAACTVAALAIGRSDRR